jgi:hypothetical protein
LAVACAFTGESTIVDKERFQEPERMKTTQHHIIESAPALQSGDHGQNDRIRSRSSAWARAGSLFAILFALLPSLGQAHCDQWDVSGTWRVVQSNGNQVEMILRVNGTEVTGTARDVQDAPLIPVTGTMVGNKFNVTVYWKGGNVGVYRGTVDAGGGMKGTTYDKSHPNGARATWYSNRSMLCADNAPVKPKPSEWQAPTAPPPIPDKPKPSVTGVAAWLGHWDTRTNQGGHFDLNIEQFGAPNKVLGTFSDLNGNPQYNGQLVGTISGNVLTYKYTQIERPATGEGKFSLHGGTIAGSGIEHGTKTNFDWWGSRKK